MLSDRAVVRTSGECAWLKKVSKTMLLVFELLKLTIARPLVTVKNRNWQNHSYQQLARWLVFKQYVYGFIFLKGTAHRVN